MKNVHINGHIVAVRQGLMERVWKLEGHTEVNGFDMVCTLYVRGTENEMCQYITSEIPGFSCRYSAVSFEEEKEISSRIYIAPEIDDGMYYGNI